MGQTHEEGLQEILEIAFAVPGNFYVGLCSDNTILKGDEYTDLVEVIGSGYGLIALSTAVVSVYNTDDRKITFNEVTFSATGTWTEAVQWFIVSDGDTSGTYKLLFSNALSAAVTLTNGESQAVTPVVNANG